MGGEILGNFHFFLERYTITTQTICLLFNVNSLFFFILITQKSENAENSKVGVKKILFCPEGSFSVGAWYVGGHPIGSSNQGLAKPKTERNERELLGVWVSPW